jgi:hypothetical protein
MLTEAFKKEVSMISNREHLHEAFEYLKRKQTQLAGVALLNFMPGDRVWFEGKGRKIEGTITKINHKTASINGGINGLWRVSPTILNKL